MTREVHRKSAKLKIKNTPKLVFRIRDPDLPGSSDDEDDGETARQQTKHKHTGKQHLHYSLREHVKEKLAFLDGHSARGGGSDPR